MTNKETILDQIKLCQVRIRLRIEEREMLRDAEKHSEVYDQIDQEIEQAIVREQSRQDKLIRIIKANPNDLQRKVLYNKYVKGYTVDQIAESLGYSTEYMREVYTLAMREIRKSCSGSSEAQPAASKCQI